ncbi:uncharacterized protein [Anoplolepis gracilipes]|uniref:uncharacterized protein n=1 Tax=Anoplolepis gracilipes TaxID=354296 RepID=UPI003BA1844B
MLSSKTFDVHPDQVYAKCYRMPFFNNTSVDDSDSNIQDTLIPQNNIPYQERQAHQGRAYNSGKRVETELKRMNNLLEKIFKCVQHRRHSPQKPTVLPITSLIDMDKFERVDEENYSDVVNYLSYIGGFNLKEAVNLCFKEAMEDSLTPSFTWWGREGGRSLYNARLTVAIYDAVCHNQHFDKPTRTEFQMQFRETLRAAKERVKHRLRGPRTRAINHERRDCNLWTD